MIELRGAVITSLLTSRFVESPDVVRLKPHVLFLLKPATDTAELRATI